VRPRRVPRRLSAALQSTLGYRGDVLGSLGGLAARRPRVLVAGAVAFTLLGIFFGGTVMGRLTSGGLSDTSAASGRADALLQQAAGGDPDSSLLAVVSPVSRVPDVVSELRSLGARSIAAPHDGKPARLISRDGRSALVVAPRITEQQATCIATAFAGDSGVVLGGGPVVSNQVDSITSSDLKKAELIALPLLLLLSFWVFRGVVAALLPPLVGFVTIAGALLGLRVASEMTSLSVYALNLITGLGLGLAIDWSLFIVSRYREELDRHGPGAEAMRATLKTAGHTVLFSALTVAAALAALLVFPQKFLVSMGIGGILVALIGAIVALVVLPAVLALLGTRVNALAPKRFQRKTERAGRPVSSGFWFRLSKLVMRRPVPIAVGAAAVLLVLGVPFSGIKLTGFSTQSLPRSASSRQVDEIIRSEFSTDLNPAAYAVVSAPAGARSSVDAYARTLGNLPGRPNVGRPELVGSGTWRVDVGTRAGESAQAGQQLVADMRAAPSRYPVLVGGESASIVDQKSSLLGSLPIALGILVGTTLLVLFLMTRSVLLPLKAIVLNLLTITAVIGVLVWIFQDGRLESVLGYTSQGGLEPMHPILIATIAFALSTDYGVFLLGRIKEARDQGVDNRTAVAFGLERTGRIVSAAALLFIVAIGAFGASRVVSIKEVGLGTGLAVLLDATIVRALLVPSLMCLAGRWNWWAPTLRPALARVRR
jgi:uncharacterized membrane protein YdfJ with MMPL/SSD domain